MNSLNAEQDHNKLLSAALLMKRNLHDQAKTLLEQIPADSPYYSDAKSLLLKIEKEEIAQIIIDADRQDDGIVPQIRGRFQQLGAMLGGSVCILSGVAMVVALVHDYRIEGGKGTLVLHSKFQLTPTPYPLHLLLLPPALLAGIGVWLLYSGYRSWHQGHG